MGQTVTSGAWCVSCGNPIPYGQVRMRQALVHVVVYELWWGFRPGKFKHYRKEPFCLRCDAREEEAERRKRAWGWAALLTSGAVIFGYGYFSLMTGLAGAGVVAVLCFVVGRRKKVEILPEIHGGKYGR